MVLNSDMIFPLKQYGSQLAVVTEDGQELSYLLLGNLIDTVNEVISEEKGLTFCLCHNSLGSLVGYLAMLQSKIPAVMLDGDKNSAVVRSLMMYINQRFCGYLKIEIRSLVGMRYFV